GRGLGYGEEGETRRGRCDLLEHCQPLACNAFLVKHDAGEITAWPSEVCSEARSDWIGDAEKNDRDCAGLALQRRRDGGRHCEDDLRLQRDQLLGKRLVSSRIRSGKAMLNVDGAALHPTKAGESLPKFRKLTIPFLVVLCRFLQHADPPHAVHTLLRSRRQRPSRRATEQRYKRAALH